MKTKDELETDKISVKELLDKHKELSENIQSLEYYSEEKEKIDNLNSQLNILKNEQRNLNTEKVGLLSQKSNLETQIETVDEKVVKHVNENKSLYDKILC